MPNSSLPERPWPCSTTKTRSLLWRNPETEHSPISFYSKCSEYYERVFLFREEVWRFLKEYAGSSGNALLDVGCGPGHYCWRLAADGFKPLGIDLDKAMIAEAQRRYPEAEFRCLDMWRVDEIGKRFDCIWSIGNVMAHLPAEELAPFIAKIHKLLKPGDHWIMQVMNLGHPRWIG